MKSMILFTILVLYSTYMWAAANDIVFTQRNATDTGTFTRFPMVPSATTGLLGFNISTVLPEWWTLGPGLQVTGTTLDVASPASFNYSQPTARSLAVSTSYQATNTSKPAIIYPSYACQNATQVLASSGCTLQVRMGTGTLTCATGTPYHTQSLTVNLGVLITQNSTNPVPIFLPAGASFILCPTAGTFTINAVEQVAG